jgi:hypothetical protein
MHEKFHLPYMKVISIQLLNILSIKSGCHNLNTPMPKNKTTKTLKLLAKCEGKKTHPMFQSFQEL